VVGSNQRLGADIRTNGVATPRMTGELVLHEVYEALLGIAMSASPA
jgi:hypothetical protein